MADELQKQVDQAQELPPELELEEQDQIQPADETSADVAVGCHCIASVVVEREEAVDEGRSLDEGANQMIGFGGGVEAGESDRREAVHSVDLMDA